MDRAVLFWIAADILFLFLVSLMQFFFWLVCPLGWSDYRHQTATAADNNQSWLWMWMFESTCIYIARSV